MTEGMVDGAGVSSRGFVGESFARLGAAIGHVVVLLALVPISVVLLVVVLAADLLAWPFVAVARLVRKDTPATERKREVSIVCVSINGRELLGHLLPSLEKALELAGGDHEVIVVDNGSEDDSVEWLAKEWPWVKVVALPENRFFGPGNNEGVKVATKDLLVFLNNDMVVEPDFLPPLLAHFDDPDVFSVSSQIFLTQTDKPREETGKTQGRWRRGEMILSHEPITKTDVERETSPVFWAGGGSAAVDRRRYLELGGFEDLYEPFYMEDTGLSYQAWKRGWRNLFAPASKVHHRHRTTGVKMFGARFIDNTTRRNYYLFCWRNFTELKKTIAHFLYLPQKFKKNADRRDYRFECRALGRALMRLPTAIWLREATRHLERRSDTEVFEIANGGAPYDAKFGRPGRGERLRVLILLARLPKRHTDGSWILVNLIRELGKRHDLTLLSFIDQESEREHAEALMPHCEEIDLLLRRQNPEFSNLHGLVPRRLALDYSDPRMHAKIEEHLGSGRYDVFQCEYLEMAHMLPDLSGVPSLFTHHEVLSFAERRNAETVDGFFEKLRRQREAMLYLRYELDVCRRFGRVVTLSNTDSEFLASYDPSLPLVNIPSGVDTRDLGPWSQYADAEEPFVLFVGYYLHPPNVDAATWLAREIFPHVKATVPNARCVLVGRSPTPQILALADDDAIEVTGFVDDLRALVAKAAVVAIPIRQGAGLRGKVLEAWSMAKAVVSTSVAAEGFEAKSGEQFLIADEPEEFAAAISTLLEDEALRRRVGDAGRALVEEKYSDVAMAKAYESMYYELLSEKGGAAR